MTQVRRAYVTEQLMTIVGAAVTPSDEQVNRWWSMLTREEERKAPRDAHGNFPHAASILAALRLLEDPPLHSDLRSLHQGDCLRRWPGKYRFAACLTHDVDRIVQHPWRERLRQAAVLRGQISPRALIRLLGAAAVYGARAQTGHGSRAPYDFWLEEEGRHGFHSTFFVLPESLQQPAAHDHFYRYCDTVSLMGQRMTFAHATRRMHEMGWEIGLHGSYASAYDAAMLRREKEALEAMLGHPATSVRQHFLRFDIDATPVAQADAGFTADSTLGYSQTIGCRAGLAFPFFWAHAGQLLEVPLIIQDVGLLRHPQEERKLPTALERARALIEQVAEIGGVLTLSWHSHPESPGAYPCYRALLELIATLGGWGCSLGELNEWWRTRHAALQQTQMRVAS